MKEKNVYICTGLSFYTVKIEFQAHWRFILFLSSSAAVRSLVDPYTYIKKLFFCARRRGFAKI